MIYLDNAATTINKPKQVEKAMVEALYSAGNSGRGAHAGALTASRLVFSTREKLAGLFNVKNPARIAFTSNATEALNIAINGMFKTGDHVISTVCEHNSVLRPLYLLEEKGVEVTYINAGRQGILNYEEMKQAVRKETRAVVVTHASNLTGNITDLEQIRQMIKGKDIYLVVDASQTAGAVPIDVEAMGIDVLCFTGHKSLMGPQGTGGIYVREGVDIAPLKVGGSGVHSYDRKHPAYMPAALEAGTLNTHGIAGLNGALSYIESVGVENIRRKELELVKQFTEEIESIDGIKIYGDSNLEHRAGIVSINLGAYDSGAVSDWLWEDYEICVRPGAHCAPRMHEALGTVSQGAVRFSFSYFTTSDEVERAARALRELV